MLAHVFSDLEGLRIACEMERRGEAFYLRAAKLSKSAAARLLLEALAGEERAHFGEFQRLYERRLAACGGCEDPYDDETNAYLSAVAADVVFPGGLMAIRREGFDSPSAVLLYAIQSEKDSVLFYTELAEKARDAAAGEVFREIARQERQHMRRLQQKLMETEGEDKA